MTPLPVVPVDDRMSVLHLLSSVLFPFSFDFEVGLIPELHERVGPEGFKCPGGNPTASSVLSRYVTILLLGLMVL
jgi:hypothetical protein